MARRVGQPSVRSRRLAGALRTHRMAAGLSIIEVAEATGMDRSKISRVEKMARGIYRDQFEKLLDLYKVTGSDRVDLLDHFHHAEERGWLRLHSDRTLPEDWQSWTELEADASAVFNYQPLMIPGLLQTPEYARAIIQGTTSGLSDSEVDRLVASRMTRQIRLTRERPLTLHAIIEESVLTRPFGDTDARVRQLRHLVELSTRPNIVIQVLPIETGLHPALYGSFVILQYADKTKLVHLEAATSTLILDEDHQIEAYTRAWTKLTRRARDPGESTKLISAIAAHTHRKN